MFICDQCKQKRKERERSGQAQAGNNWCISCFKAEMSRSTSEDSTGTYIRSRPPKFMLQPHEYEAFGYPKDEK